MIVDTLERLSAYAALAPQIETVIAYLQANELSRMPVGRIRLDGDNVYINIEEMDGRRKEAARLEVHRRYIDIHIPFVTETIGWRPLASCQAIEQPYNDERDYAFFEDVPEQWVAIRRGHFAIFLPGDPHAPCVAEGRLNKAIVKIRQD